MSSICQRFVQNAWKKDLCSNCFKSKEEHTNLKTSTKRPKLPPLKNEPPPKGIMKSLRANKTNKRNVGFAKEISEVIGFGGEWSDSDNESEDHDYDEKDDFQSTANSSSESSCHDDCGADPDLIDVTKTNTDFNTDAKNLLGNAKTTVEGSVKKTYASLKLGASPQKTPLKITVLPFGVTNGSGNKVNDMKYKFTNTAEKNKNSVSTTKTIASTDVNIKKTDDAAAVTKETKNIVVTEKSLLEEISETLEQNKHKEDAINLLKSETKTIPEPIVINSVTSTLEASKRSLTRHNPIKKDQAKPKITVFPKQNLLVESSDDNSSDPDNTISAYYDVVVETNNYENVPQDADDEDETAQKNTTKVIINPAVKSPTKKKSSFFSSQLISDMFLSKKPISEHLKRSAAYNLSDRTYITSKITSDGLIVTKNSNEDVLDSSGSSFDSSSDEEMSSMNRSESDSGIGISVTNEYQNIEDDNRITEFNGYDLCENRSVGNKTLEKSNSSDYEDIQVIETTSDKIFSPKKSRELAGEPDGRSDPDGSAEAPALPTSPPPNLDARKSFLHSLQQKKVLDKPKVPTKPTVSVIKTFAKRNQNVAQQQVIMQLQQVMKPLTTENTTNDLSKSPPSVRDAKPDEEIYKSSKKGRAPNPPPSPTKEESPSEALIPTLTSSDEEQIVSEEPSGMDKSSTDFARDDAFHSSSLYTRHPVSSIKSQSPVVREKDKRERATVNPKFRSLNTFSTNRSSYPDKARPTTPEPAPRKSLSLSQDSLHNLDLDKKKKNKFSIKKFLRMGTSSSKNPDNSISSIKSGIYSEVSTIDDSSSSPGSKPRLIIIHPLDINNTGVEVVKDMKSTTPESTPSAINVMETTTTKTVVGKPPAPPLRNFGDGVRGGLDASKPARPPPPKSAELRRKQQMVVTNNEKASPDSERKRDNVYANLGEVRSSIAPRKPERTASMRGEKDSTIEMPRRTRPIGQYENMKPGSSCSDTSSNIDGMSKESDFSETESNTVVSRNPSNASDMSFNKATSMAEDNNHEMHHAITTATSVYQSPYNSLSSVGSKRRSETSSILSDGIKNSVQKMSSTIDSYLKDKMSTSSAVVPSPSAVALKKSLHDIVELRSSASFMDTTPLTNGGGFEGDKSEYRKSEQIDLYAKKFNQVQQLPRAISMSYCGSEIGGGDSEIYSPYSFYSSEAGTDVALGDPQDGWTASPTAKSRPGKSINRLRMRKGRSIVHKNLEDNYGAVVVANHEALAQVLEQLQQAPIIPIHLRPIANSINLRFEDFSLVEGARGVVVGRRAFHSAIWPNHIQVTLALTADCNQMSGVSGELNQLSGGLCGALNPIAEYCDLVPSTYLPLMPSTQVRMIQATISVFSRMQIDTLQSFGTILKSKSTTAMLSSNNTFGGSIPNLSSIKDQKSFARNGSSVQNLSTMSESIDEESCFTESTSTPINGISNYEDILFREVGFVMLQLINGLKNLQGKGIEELPMSLSNIILCKEVENKDAQARLCVLQSLNQDLGRDEEEPMGTLCQCAHTALTVMLPHTKFTGILSKILLQEKSDSLSKTKSILEFAIWGPSDITLSGIAKERELTLQRWLDLERATVLHGLVRTRVELTVYDECHLMFLVRSTAKIMCEASTVLASIE